jgi:hypothetical protein
VPGYTDLALHQRFEVELMAGRLVKAISTSHPTCLRCVCENMAFTGAFTPMLAKHSKNFSLQDSSDRCRPHAASLLALAPANRAMSEQQLSTAAAN